MAGDGPKAKVGDRVEITKGPLLGARGKVLITTSTASGFDSLRKAWVQLDGEVSATWQAYTCLRVLNPTEVLADAWRAMTDDNDTTCMTPKKGTDR